MDSLLRSEAEQGYRDFSAGLIPNRTDILGVRIPKLRRIAKDICKGDWKVFLEERSRSFEHTMVRGLVIAMAPISVEERISYTEYFLPEIDNWSVNDTFCSVWKIGKKDDPDVLWSYCVDLVGRHQEFPSRTGAVMMLDHFLDDRHIDKICDTLVSAPPCGYYYDMGAAWTLSMCFAEYPEKTGPVLFDGRLDPGILKTTVRKICDSYKVDKNTKDLVRDRLARRSS